MVMCATRVITFKLDEETIEKLDELAELYSVSRSEVIRKAIDILLSNDKRDECLEELLNQETLNYIKHLCKGNKKCIYKLVRTLVEDAIHLFLRAKTIMEIPD